ncbi:MAG: hypothetical protein KKB31_06505 [Nanoarchaeota archaeon]|nr:hypothetical protein [Nanoarchaeota archaeon]
MNELELRRRVDGLSKKLSENELIPKAMHLAEKFGEGGSTSSEWASAEHSFNQDSVNVHYRVYAMGDREIKISYEDGEVFHTKERVNTPPNPQNPIVLIGNRDIFEVLLYRLGNWEHKISSLYRQATTEVSEDVRNDTAQRFGIKDPR